MKNGGNPRGYGPYLMGGFDFLLLAVIVGLSVVNYLHISCGCYEDLILVARGYRRIWGSVLVVSAGFAFFPVGRSMPRIMLIAIAVALGGIAYNTMVV